MTTTATTGVLGGTFRADVTASGDVVPWDGSAPLSWHVAADDRWHSPAHEVAVRQHRIAGAPVLETRLRIPGGDAVQRVWSVADGGGRTVVEVRNDSPLPIACAFTRADVLTARPPADVPIEGIDLPAGTVVLPIGHRTAVSVALAHATPGPGTLPPGGADAEATARGWVAFAERASRLVLPDAAGEAAVAARAELALAGLADPLEDPVGHLLGAGELARLGELEAIAGADALDDVAVAVHAVARRRGWDVDAALDAAAVVLAGAGERRAGQDLARIVAARQDDAPPAAEDVAGLRALAALERGLVRGGRLFPDGIPVAWRGTDLEAHGLVAGPASTLGFALRWHGANAALIWELDGVPVELSAPAVDRTWRSKERAGEALLRIAP